MKKIINLIIASQFLICLTLSAQNQQISFIAGTRSAPILSYDTPQDPKSILKNSPLTIRIIVSDISKLTKLDFIDLTGVVKLSLNHAQLASLNSRGLITLSIVNNKITEFSSSATVPFPFRLNVSYDSKVINSTDIGGAAPPQVPLRLPTHSQSDAVHSTDTHSPVGSGTATATTSSTSVTPANLIDGSKNTGIAYYDAMSIYHLMQLTSNQPLYDYMSQFYFKTILAIKTKTELLAAVSGNTFLTNAFNGINADKDNIAAPNGGASPISSSIGGLDVTNIANGLAQLMIKRAKEELTIAFFDRFQTFAAKYPEFQIMFPKTYDNLKSFPSYSYAKWLPALRAGFYSDIQTLPTNIGSLLKLNDIQNLLKNLPEISIAIRTIGLADSIKSGKVAVVDAVNHFANFPEIVKNTSYSMTYKNFANSVELVSIFSQSLRNFSENNLSSSWIRVGQLDSLVSDGDRFNIFLGLIYQKSNSESIKFYKSATDKDTTTTVPFTTIMKSGQPTILRLDTAFTTFLSIAKDADSIRIDLQNKKAKNTPLTNDDYYNYIHTALNVLQGGADIAKKFYPKLDLDFDFLIIRKADDVYKGIYEQQYSQAMLNFVYILDTIANRGTLNSKTTKTVKKIGDAISTYGGLIAGLIDAKSSSDVESAIEQAVLPVGSYSIKQNSYLNVSLNGYIGYAWAYDNHFKDLYSKGIYAPIGISVSRDFKPWNGFNLPVTAFISFLDIGSVVSYQLANNEVNGTTSTGSATSVNTSSVNQQVKLGSIFSPSAQLFFEWRKWPFAFGVGWRRTPTLSYSSGQNYAIVGSKSVFNATILIDIPFFTFYNNPRNQK